MNSENNSIGNKKPTKMLFEKSGAGNKRNPPINPIIIDNIAAIIESCIVAENPLNKNVILFHPAFVVGSITYQPQVPGGEEQLANKVIKRIAMTVFFCTVEPF